MVSARSGVTGKAVSLVVHLGASEVRGSMLVGIIWSCGVIPGDLTLQLVVPLKLVIQANDIEPIY
jgi:hypothetical protein